MENELARKVLIRYLPDLMYSYRTDRHKHDYYQRTIAIEMPTASELRTFIVAPDLKHVMYLKFAEAKKHPKEPFVKKEGRKLVLERLSKSNYMELHLESTHLDKDRQEFFLTYRVFYRNPNGPEGYGEGFTFKLRDGKAYYVGEVL